MQKMVFALVLVLFLVIPTLGLSPLAQGTERVTIKFAVDKNIPPYSFMENGKLVGFHIDLLNAMEKYTPYKFEYLPVNWDDAVPYLKEGVVDAIIGIVPTPEREKYFDFTYNYSTIDYYFFAREDESKLMTLSQLNNSTVAVVKDDISEYELKKMVNITKMNITLVEVMSMSDGLLLLSHEEVDYFLGTMKTCIYWISRLHIHNVVLSDLKLISLPVAMAVRKGEWDLLGNLNDALLKVRDSGEFSDIYAKWFLYKNTQVPSLFPWILAIVAVGVVAFAGWEYGRASQREKRARKKVTNLEKFSRVLMEKMPVGLMYIFKDKCLYINPEGLSILGYGVNEINKMKLFKKMTRGNEIKIKTKDGSEKWLLIRRIYAGDAEIIAFMDITVKKMFEEKERERFEEINNMLDALRNPVQDVLLASENLSDERMQEIVRNNVEKISEILRRDIV